jgi:hypothetical protein
VPHSQKLIDCCITCSAKPSLLAIFSKNPRPSRRIQVKDTTRFKDGKEHHYWDIRGI